MTLAESAAADAPKWFNEALAAPSISGRVRVDGALLHYRAWELARPELPVVWLVHGFGGHTAWWDFVAPALADRHRVIALDLSGMGDSDRRSTYPPGVGARDIIGAIDALGVGPVIGIGHSAGGVRLLTAAAKRPDLFQRLIVVDSYVVFQGRIHPEAPARSKSRKLYPDRDAIVARFRLLPDQSAVRPWALAHIAAHSAEPTEGGWRWKTDPTLPTGASVEVDGDVLLPKVTVPVHYVHAEESSIVSPDLAERIVATLPQGRGPIGVPGAHHHMMIDQPEALIATLRALLA